MIVIVSYRQEWEQRCTRSCRCLEGSAPSNFEMHLSDNEEEAATYIAQRLHEDHHASYIHLLFDRWEDVIAQARHGSCNSPTSAEHSIMVPYVDIEDFGDGDAEYDDYQAEQDRKGIMCATVTKLVVEKLGVLSVAAKVKKREEESRQQAQRNRLDLERAQAEVERLKKQTEFYMK